MKKLIGLFITIILSLALGACSGGNSGSVSTSVNITMTDFQFTPNTFTVPAGQKIAFTATNNGSVEHSFVIMKLGSDLTTNFNDQDQANVYWEKTVIQPGQSVTDSFTAPSEPGTYQIVCAVPGHFEAGMIAKLVVVAGG